MQHDTGFSIYSDYLPGHSDKEHEAEVQVQTEAEEPKGEAPKGQGKGPVKGVACILRYSHCCHFAIYDD
jgi:hypothetical protein